MKLPLLTISDAVDRDLCCGCGACAAVEPDAIRMVDSLEHGRRPVVDESAELDPDTNAICPGMNLERVESVDGAIESLESAWGPVLEIWEGHAIDEDIRFRGSSGGIVTALAAFALESEEAAGICHIRGRDDVPYLNTSVISRSREELVQGAGARYAPASPCERLGDVKESGDPHMFIGKPCDVSASYAMAQRDPALARSVMLNVAIFCAGTPTLRGTLNMLKHMGVEDPRSLTSLRYRGHGWPGRATADVRDANGEMRRHSLSYDAAWGDILRRHKQWRCHVCPDHTGEHADISVGDPWYRPIKAGESGRSLILVRTERGRAFLQRALRAGAISVTRVDAETLPASQPSLLRAQSAIWGRLLGMRLLRLPVPRYRGRPLLRNWMTNLSWSERLRSVFGVLRHTRRRRLHAASHIQPMETAARAPRVAASEPPSVRRARPTPTRRRAA